MLNAFFSDMHRHTRPSAYADKSRQGRISRMQRPGASSFSFTGDFPEDFSQQPLEAQSRRRSYTSQGSESSRYQAVGSMDTQRDPMVSRYGVRLVPAVCALVVLCCVLGFAWLSSLVEESRLAVNIHAQQAAVAELTEKNARLTADIARSSDDVNIRQQAVALGLVSAKGADVVYLTAPEAEILPGMNTTAQGFAAITGQ